MTTIDDQLSALLEDPDFRAIQGRMGRFNLFEAIGAVNGELRHSNFLAFLLSPSRPHGLGARVIQQVLRRVIETVPADKRPISTLELMVGDIDDAVVHRERDNIDILIEIEALDLVVLIENKIHAKAGHGQLRRYRQLIDARYPSTRKLLIFLTPDGHPPDDTAYWPLSYITLGATLEDIIEDLPATDPTQLIVRHYVDMLRTHIVEDAHLRSLAAKLYERHAEALDFIFESRPNSSLVELVAQRVRSIEGLQIDTDTSSMLRFAPDRWDEFLSYRIDPKAWTRSGRGLLFEVKHPKPGRVNVALVLGPGDERYRTALYEAARQHPDVFPGLVKPMGYKFSTIFSRDLITSQVAAGMSAEVVANNVSLAWSDFQGTALPTLIEAVLTLDREIIGPLEVAG